MTAALFETLMSESSFGSVSTVTWDAILVTVDGFGFGTLTGESCLKFVLCHTDRASWDVIRDSCLFWSPHVEKVCTVTQIRLGEGGGGIPLRGCGGRGRGRRTENRDHIYIYIYIYYIPILPLRVPLYVHSVKTPESPFYLLRPLYYRKSKAVLIEAGLVG